MVGGHCLFLECRQRPISQSGRGISLHRFPSEPGEFALWETWVRDVCGMTNFVHCPSTTVLCSRHFPDNSFHLSGKNRLRKYALPSITPKDLNAAETLGLSLNPDLVQTESADAQRKAASLIVTRPHLHAKTEGASSSTLNSSGDTSKATKSTKPKTSLGECDDAQKAVLEDQNNGGSPSNPTSRLQTKRKFAIDVSPDNQNSCLRAERHLNILQNALARTRNRLYAQSYRIKRVENSVVKIHKLVQTLKEEKLVTEKGQLELDCAVSNIVNQLCKK